MLLCHPQQQQHLILHKIYNYACVVNEDICVVYMCEKRYTSTSKMLTYFSSLLPINEHYDAFKDVSSFLLLTLQCKILNECDLSIHENKIIGKISAYIGFEILLLKSSLTIWLQQL